MNHLIVFSHPNPKSFNQAILEIYTQTLKEQGHDVRVRDVYALKFDPVLSADDLVMAQKKTYADDVVVEQEHVKWADVITMISPIWWGGVTANMRGYIDRVFSSGFAYSYTEKGLEQGFKGKKVVFINTMGAPYDVYEKMGMIRSMSQTIDECISDFTGIEVVARRFFGSVVSCSQEEREGMLEDIKSLAKEI